MSLARAVALNTAVQVAGRIAGLLASIVITAILTRHLGITTYGQMVAASTYVALFTILGDAGIYLVAVRRAAQDAEARPRILGTALWLRLVVALVPLGIGWALVQFVPSERFPTYVPAVKLAVAVLALNGYLTLLNQFLIAIFRLHLRMDLAVLGEVTARLIALGCVGLVAATGGGLLAAVTALLAGTLSQFLFGWFVSRRFERFAPRLDRGLAASMLRESGVIAIVTLLGLVHFKVDTLMLSVMKSAADVGIYGVAYRVLEVLITFPGMFVGLLYPVFARLVQEDPVRLRAVFQRAFDVLVVTSLGAALLVYVLAQDLAALLGAEAAARPMRTLSMALPAVFVGLGFTHLLLAEAKQRWMVPLYVGLVIANVGCNAVAIRLWSYNGAAAVTVLTEGLSLTVLAVYWVGRRRLHLAPRSLAALPLAVAIALLARAAHGLWLATPTNVVPVLLLRLVAVGLAATLLYAGGLLAGRIVPIETLRSALPASFGGPRRAGPATLE